MVDFRKLMNPKGFHIMLWGRVNPPKILEWLREYENNPMAGLKDNEREG